MVATHGDTLCDILSQHQSSINHRRHPRRTKNCLPSGTPYGSSEVVKSLALEALDPFRVLLRCHPFSWNWCLAVGSEARTPSAGHQTPPARDHSEGLLPPCHGARQGLGCSPISLRFFLTIFLWKGWLTSSLDEAALRQHFTVTTKRLSCVVMNFINCQPMFSRFHTSWDTMFCHCLKHHLNFSYDKDSDITDEWRSETLINFLCSQVAEQNRFTSSTCCYLSQQPCTLETYSVWMNWWIWS